MSEQDCVPYALVLGENHLVLGEPAILGVLVTRRHVFDPQLGVERRRQALCGGRRDPLPWRRSSLVKPGIKMTVDSVSWEET